MLHLIAMLAFSLTPQEAAEGWLNLFDGETTLGWKIKGPAKVDKGALIIGGTEAVTVTSTSKFQGLALEVHYRSMGPSAIRWSDKKYDVPAKADGMFKFSGGEELMPIAFEVPAGSTLTITQVKVKPNDLAPIFNGKDLTGWKVFPDKKSKFAVIDGAINIQDGPGDLQTDGKYQNFILQLECKSHGMHLNSGVFFRCRAGEYQNGYEAQIRNQFTPEAKQEYVVEDYDPKTHELIGKRKILSTAFDFGTGAIYRRIPARKEVAKDGEWFTLTVLAQGNHLATWVNGVQQVDWFDNRKLSDNARTGCKLEPGHLSFQGHDPTTNLSFKNIRIVEVK